MKTVSLPLPLTWLQPFDFPHKLGICERLFGKALARHGICWVPTAAGIDWKLDLTVVPHRWIVYGKVGGKQDNREQADRDDDHHRRSLARFNVDFR